MILNDGDLYHSMQEALDTILDEVESAHQKKIDFIREQAHKGAQ